MRASRGRIEYPALRDTLLTIPTTNTPAPNFWSLDHDAANWVSKGKGFSMYRSERPYHESQKPASATDFYNTDQGAKTSLAHKVQRSPYRYVSMREQSSGRGGDTYLGTYIGTSERVGPGAYALGAYREHKMPRCEPYSSSFASGVPRAGSAPKLKGEVGYSTLATDLATWNLHGSNRQLKGASFSKSMRWERPPGPGSNRPADKSAPGPGAYGRLHSWPEAGFLGSARGFNHNRSVG